MTQLRVSERKGEQEHRERSNSRTEQDEELRGEYGGVIAGIPAYNEEISIGSVVVSASRFVDEVVVIDDGSTDSTSQIAAAAGATVLMRETNEGKGAAIRTLLQYLETRKYRAVVLLDGDGQHTPNDIPRVVDPVLEGDADLVIGSRYAGEGARDETPLYRRVGQRLLDVATNASSGTQLNDSQSGFRALSPKTVVVMSTDSDGYSIESEMIYDASRNGLRITEAPIDVRYEGIDGQTANPLWHGVEVLRFVIGVIRRRHPLLYFGVPGAILLFGGTFYALGTATGGGAVDPLQLLLGNWVSIIGGVFLTVGLVLDVVFDEFQRYREPGR